jgi:hypothetical protein
MKGKSKRPPDPNRPANNPDFPNLKVSEKLYKSGEELQKKVDEYFERLKGNTKEVMSASGAIKEIADPLIPTLEDFASFLGFRTLKSLTHYGSAEGYEEFHEIIEVARGKILGMKTIGLVNGKGSTSGLIFDLVNNHGYKNKQEIESDNKNDTTIRVVYE